MPTLPRAARCSGACFQHALIWFAVGVAVATPPAFAHEVHSTISSTQATVVRLTYADGAPFSFESYEIYPEGKEMPVQVGRTDEVGRIVFAPPAAGSWRVRAFSADGHGVDLRLDLSDGAGAAGETENSGGGRFARLAAGVGIILGFFALLLLFRHRRASVCTVLLMLAATSAFAHHGVASLGAAGLEGPGAPVETSSSATLPVGSVLSMLKLDYASFETLTPERDDEKDANAFWMYGLGYGLQSWCSLYLIAPFYTKTVEDNSFTSSGFADMGLMGVLGLRWDRGWVRFVPAKESLDDLEDWHFTLYGGLTLPTGKANLRDATGSIDPGMSLGFGRPSYSAGISATKQLGRVSLVLDGSWIGFNEHEYADGARVQFGEELRFNTALPVRLYANGDRQLRVDGVLESSLLALGRDRSDGHGERATGGHILYVMPGARLYYKRVSLAAGIKWPTWTDLNEEDEQQGAEGKEDYRAVIGFSVLS